MDFSSEDYEHTAALLKKAIADGNEPMLRAVLSNNLNIVLGALDFSRSVLLMWNFEDHEMETISASAGRG